MTPDNPKHMTADDLTRLATKQHTPPSAIAAAFARLLMAEPSTYIPALAQAMVEIRGKSRASVVAWAVLKEVEK